MARRGTRRLLAACAVVAATFAAPDLLHGQSILKRIKDQAAKRVADGRAKVDSTVLHTTGTAVDSAVSKTNRGADAVAGKVANVANGAIEATERGVTSLAGGGADPVKELAAKLATGRAVLGEIRFVAGTDQLEPGSEAVLKQLAAALGTTTGTILIEAHTEAVADAPALSQRRASAVKNRLVAAGVPADRLVAVGYGATRPTAANSQTSARIEVVRAQ